MSNNLIEYLKREQVLSTLESFPFSTLVVDRKGHLKFYNSAHVQLLDKEPELHTRRWHEDFTFYDFDGTPVNCEVNPVDLFLDEESRNEARKWLIAEHPSGEQFRIKPYSSQLFNEEGEMLGSIIMLISADAKGNPAEFEKSIARFERKDRLYEAILSSTPDLAYIFDLNYRFIFANDALLKMWGVSENEYLGKGLREIGYEEWHARMHEREIDQVVSTKEPVQGEVAFHHAELGKRFYEYIFVPVLNNDNEVEAVAGTTRDVTRRKETEEALRRNEEKYRTLVENFPNGAVALFDKDLRFTAVGGGLVDSTGVDPDDRIDSRIHDIYPDDLVNRIEPDFQAALRGEAKKFDLKYNGLYLSVQVLPIEDDDGEVVAGMLVVLDITERWQARRALRKSEEKYRSLFKSMNEGFAVIQMEFDENDEPVNFHFLETNPAYYKHSGLENVEGKSAKEIIPDLGENLLRRNGQVALTGEPFNDEIYVGEIDRWLNLSAFRIGEPEEHKVAVIFTNITERKQTQRELERVNETLEERVEERTQSLRTYQDKLRSLVFQLSRTEEKQRQQLATELHENLGQLLALSKMKANKIQNRYAGNDPAVDELKEVLEDAITYTRELSSDLKPPPSVHNDFRASINWLTEKISSRGLAVTVDDDNRPKHLDEKVKVIVLQSVRELLFNIIEHTSEKNATIRLRRTKGSLKIVVEDQGAGFDLKKEEFASTEEKKFGLFNIRERIDLLGGSLHIETKKDCGTKVTLQVPLSKDQHPKQRIAQAEGGTTGATLPPQSRANDKTKVLLVDDHKMFRNGLRKIIKDEDDMIIIGEAGNGKKAIALNREISPDVILMDVSMPVIDGVEATQQIKKDRPDVRVIGLSLHDSEEVMQEMLDAGASAYVTKTEAFESLIETIRTEVSHLLNHPE